MDWNNREEVNAYNREYRRKNGSNKKYYEAHKERILAQQKEYAAKNKDRIKEWSKKYREEHKEERKAYRESRKELTSLYNKEYHLKYYPENKDRIKERVKEYSKTQMGRAIRLYESYKWMDRRNGFEEAIDFDAKWITDNIFGKPCAHCGETDWHKLGCNRIDNTKPHTIDNVEPCCFHCNCVLNGKETSLKKKNR